MADHNLSRAELDAAVATSVLQESPEAFMAVDADCRVIAWNPAAEALTGWTAEEALGRYPPHWPPPDPAHPPPSEQTGLGLRYRKDGSAFVAVVERDVPLCTPEGREIGRGRFFRAAPDEELLLQRNKLSRDLVEAVRIEEVREVLHRAVVELLHARQAFVLTPTAGFDRLQGHLAIGANQEEAESIRIPLDRSGAARGAVLDRRITTGSAPVGVSAQGPGAFVPMGPRAAGWVLMMVFEQDQLEAPTTEALWEAVAAEAWTALRRVELVAELEGKVEILEATAAISGSAGLDLDEVLGAVCHQAASALSCERAGVYLRSDDGSLALAHLYATDLDISVPQGHRAAEELLRAAEPVVIQDATACPFLEGPWHPITGTVSVFGLPLTVGERDIGVLVVAHTLDHPRGFTNLCLQVGDAVANQAALAIENARLFANERATVTRLQELDRMKGDFIDGLSHDLRTPLTGMLGFVDTLQRTAETATAEERDEYLAIINRQARRIAGMVEDLLTSARLEAGALAPEVRQPVGVREIVTAALDSLAPDHRARVSASVDDLVVEGDRSLLARAVQNLIDNALKHSPAEERVDVDTAQEDPEVLISVSDRGPGIDEDLRQRLFSRFGPGRGRDSVGLGLYITRGIVQAHGGEVSAITRPGTGTTFTIRLPAAGGRRSVAG